MKRDHALVVGGGFSGLVAARVLADHFESVVVLEKDPQIGSTEARAGVAQGAHLHVLLKRGQEILQSLFPGIESQFNEALCPKIDWAADTHWETKVGAFPRYESAIKTYSFSRPFLESALYSFLAKQPNVSFRKEHVQKLILKDGLATHVECFEQSECAADLIVLAGGQHFPLGRFMAQAAIEKYTQSSPIQITYRSVVFETDTLNFEGFKQYYYQLAPPTDPIGAVVCPIENNRSIATIVQYGSVPSSKTDLSGFIKLAGSVPGGKFCRIVEHGVPLTSVSVFHKPSMYLRRLGKVSGWPENVFAMGDILCSLNPVFGQGMTISLQQGLLLQSELKKKNMSANRFHRKSVKQMRLPFLLSKIGSSLETGIKKRYLESFISRCQTSERLHRKFLDVLHLKASFGSLLDPYALGSALQSRRGSHD